MIHKAILDALAVVIKEERERFEKLIAKVKVDLSAESAEGLNDIIGKVDIISESLSDSIDRLEGKVADELEAKLIKQDSEVFKQLTDHFDQMSAAWRELEKRLLEKASDEVEEKRVKIQQEVDNFVADMTDTITESLKRVRDGRDGKDGENGVDGKDGVDGKEGKDGEQGEKGIDGKHGRDGLHGEDGVDGVDGRDGIDGADGKDGSDGIDRDLVSPYYPAENDSLERNDLAYSQGGLYQATRKTVGCPKTDPNSYRLVLSGITEIKGTYIKEERLTRICIRSSDGTSAFMDIPDGVDGADGIDGEKGEQGDQGIRGRKGVKGDIGVGVEDVLVEKNHVVITLTDGRVTSLPLEIPPVPEQVKMHGIHVRAPDNPPVDYLWVNPKGQAQIWDGKKWIKIQ